MNLYTKSDYISFMYIRFKQITLYEIERSIIIHCMLLFFFILLAKHSVTQKEEIGRDWVALSISSVYCIRSYSVWYDGLSGIQIFLIVWYSKKISSWYKACLIGTNDNIKHMFILWTIYPEHFYMQHLVVFLVSGVLEKMVQSFRIQVLVPCFCVAESSRALYLEYIEIEPKNVLYNFF